MSGATERTPFAAAGLYAARQRDRRVWWLHVLDLVIPAAEQVAEGGELSKDEAFDVVGAAVRMGEVPFPIPTASATAAAAGFRELARGFTGAHGEVRQALAGALAAAGRCCRRMLEIEVEQQAAATRRRLGEDD